MTLITTANINPNNQHIKRKADGDLARCLNEKGIAIISGQAQVGKTELASEYYFEHQKDYHYCFWLRASSREELLLELQAIMTDDKTPSEIKSLTVDFKDIQSALKKLKKILENMSSNWLIVIDNLSIKELDIFLPLFDSDKKHHVIITVDKTNSPLFSSKAPTPLIVDTFELTEIESLFANRLPNKTLTSQDKATIAQLRVQLGTDLDVLVLASRIYPIEEKRKELLALNSDSAHKLKPADLRRKLYLIHLSSNAQLVEALQIVSFYDAHAVPRQWLSSANINSLKEFGILTREEVESKQIALETSWQAAFASELAETDFNTYDKFYSQALQHVIHQFTWTRTNYNKKLKTVNQPNYPKEQSNMALLALAVLSKFTVWQQKAELAKINYASTTLLPIVQLTNSLGRYHFIQEWFEQALDYYQAAKKRFDVLLSDKQLKYLNKEARTDTEDKAIFKELLDKYGYEVCLHYAQEILHNMGATIVKISWSAEKDQQLTLAVTVLKLAYDWQIYLISNFNVTAKPFVQHQLGLDNSKQWTEDEIKAQLYHFANFTRRILAQAYIQKKDFPRAEALYKELAGNEDYMRNPETKPLAYRDLANVQRRQNKLNQAMDSINQALPLLEVKDFPAKHYPGEKEQVLYERAKIYLAKHDLNNAESDLNAIIQLNSGSWLYKAKTYYQLARIAKEKKNALDERYNLEQSLEAIKGRNPLKQKAYERYYQVLAIPLTKEDQDKLNQFANQFIREFLTTLKETIANLKHNKTDDKLKLAFGVIEAFFKLVPKVEVSLPSGIKISSENPLPEAVNSLAQSLLEYRQTIRKEKLSNIEEVKQDLQQAMKTLAELITTQYSHQLKCLTENDIKRVVNNIVNSLIEFIKAGKVLTPEDGYTKPVAEQLMKVLLDNIKKESLTTLKPAVNKKWNTRSLFNKSAFFVEVEKGKDEEKDQHTNKVLYARSNAELDQHHKYGYSILKRKPMPEEYFKSYQSEAELEHAKEAEEPHKSRCIVM